MTQAEALYPWAIAVPRHDGQGGQRQRREQDRRYPVDRSVLGRTRRDLGILGHQGYRILRRWSDQFNGAGAGTHCGFQLYDSYAFFISLQRGRADACVPPVTRSTIGHFRRCHVCSRLPEVAMRAIQLPMVMWLACAMVAGLPAVATAQDPAGPAKMRAPVTQPALKQSSAPQSRSAQSYCVREANRRGFVVLDTRNFQQYHDGWSVDMRVRNSRGQATDGSCFVETQIRRRDPLRVRLGLRRRWRRPHAVQLRFNRQQVPRMPAAGEWPRHAGQAPVASGLRRRPHLGPAWRPRVGRPGLPRGVRVSRYAARGATGRWTAIQSRTATANAPSVRGTSAGWCARTAAPAASRDRPGAHATA